MEFFQKILELIKLKIKQMKLKNYKKELKKKKRFKI